MAAPKRRKPAASRREKLIKVLVTDEEHQRLQDVADKAGMSLSTWVRATVLQVIRK